MSRPRPAQVVGLDWATDPKKCGVVRARWAAPGIPLEVQEVCSGVGALERVGGWLEEDRPTLLAVDAPLGWPQALAKNLVDHRAGELLAGSPEQLFRRRTDVRVQTALRKRPLDVGADRIARTAHAALDFVEQLRRRGAGPLPLAWEPGHLETSAVIEVYPAALLTGRGVVASGYKGKDPEAWAARGTILGSLADEWGLAGSLEEALLVSDHLLDAALAALAGADFLAGAVLAPEAGEEAARARIEGWIWFRPRRGYGPGG